MSMTTTIEYQGVTLECQYVMEGLKGLDPRDPDTYTFTLEQVLHGGEDVTPLLDEGILETIEGLAEKQVNLEAEENQADWLISQRECFA